ncbi:MDR family MFS transporter [Flavobacterium sp.]|uniref:MDR family MFS transporter n=1 Tax=Flavobacterium sp. TaxID=239 RepID=UPI0040338506
MFRQAISRYVNNFRGFRREIWILAIITFINRAGTMVFPFLTKYMREDLGFSYEQVGAVIMCFGLGSMLGSWLGGKLSDKFGFYKIMIFSLFTSGLMFFGIQHITTFKGLCIGMFSIMVIADMFRPAMFVSVSTYAKPENRTRAMTLVRLAVNLGFAAGPAMGGLIIVALGYNALFWIDGATCITAILIFRLLVKEKKKVATPEIFTDEIKESRTLRKDKLFWVFLFCSFATAMVFFQLLTSLPLYHNVQYGLTEFHTGLLMSFNGLMVFALEMPLVGYFERKHVPKLRIVGWGALLIALSFLVLLFEGWIGILIISIILITFGEMFNFPFSNSFAFSRAPRGQEGLYMGWYTMMFSLAHIASAQLGMMLIAKHGYAANWLVMGIIGVFSFGCCILLQRMIMREDSAIKSV